MEVVILAGRRLFAAAVLIVLFCGSAGAAGGTPGSGVIGVILPATGADRSLQNVLAGSFTVQFTLRKAALHIADSGAEAAFTLRRALTEAAAKNAQYLLVGTYSTTATEILLQVELYNVANSQKIRSATATGRIDLSMDTLVAQALEKTLTGITFQEASAVVVVPPPDTTPQPIAPATTGPHEPTTTPAVVAGSGREQPWKLFGISSGVAPMIATGPAANYTKLGLLTTFAVDLRFRAGAGALEAGILSGACWMSATGVVSTANILIIPVGVDLQYLLNSGAFPGVTLHASGGPALMSVNAGYTGTETKIVPYVLGGLTLDLPFDPSLGLSVQANYVAFLESSLVIMAFAPGVSLYVRL
jgi:hypothetical protein